MHAPGESHYTIRVYVFLVKLEPLLLAALPLLRNLADSLKREVSDPVVLLLHCSGSAQALWRAAASRTNNVTSSSQVLPVSGELSTFRCLQHALAHIISRQLVLCKPRHITLPVSLQRHCKAYHADFDLIQLHCICFVAVMYTVVHAAVALCYSLLPQPQDHAQRSEA
jgi:hypothetical protein